MEEKFSAPAELRWNTPSEFSTQNLSILLTVCHTFLMCLYLKISSCWINQQLKLIFYFLFVIFLFDRVLMLSSTITYWSLLPVKRLKEITYHCTTAAVEEEVTSIWTKRNLLDLRHLIVCKTVTDFFAQKIFFFKYDSRPNKFISKKAFKKSLQ